MFEKPLTSLRDNINQIISKEGRVELVGVKDSFYLNNMLVKVDLNALDNLRYLMVVSVLIYHSIGAYATIAPHWIVHDTGSLMADMIRELFDVFMMPVLFFIAGYFALDSLRKKGAGGTDKGRN